MHPGFGVQAGGIRGNDREQLTGIVCRLHRGAGGDDLVDVGMAQKKFAHRKLGGVVRSLELALLISCAFHDGLSDPVVEAEMLMCVGLPPSLEIFHQLDPTGCECTLLAFEF